MVDSTALLVGVLVCSGIYLLTAILYALIPAPIVQGYVVDQQGNPLLYRLGAFRVCYLVVVLFISGYLLQLYDVAYFIDHFYSLLFGANVIGLGFSFFYYITRISRPIEKQDRAARARSVGDKLEAVHLDVVQKPGFAIDFYNGLEFNPRYGSFDVKMFLYVVGATMLQIFLVAALLKQIEDQNTASNAMICVVVCLSFFVAEYVYHEHVHVYTYDIFAEKVGFKLLWGCFVFYPFFYCIAMWDVLAAPISDDISGLAALGCAMLYLSGWTLTRGANNQKYLFKTKPSQKFLGFIAPKSIGNRVLYSGFWGVSRHINYAGEILQAVAVALAAFLVSGSLRPWLYPAYYAALLIPRQLDDEELCAKKYKEQWAEYVKLVPWRIFPYVY
eukprot:m.125490 g.125490  ORF g.125490 m.125490 type:complete len:387 (-) comp23468_c0_seq2:38-1198(-)